MAHLRCRGGLPSPTELTLTATPRLISMPAVSDAPAAPWRAAATSCAIARASRVHRGGPRQRPPAPETASEPQQQRRPCRGDGAPIPQAWQGRAAGGGGGGAPGGG